MSTKRAWKLQEFVAHRGDVNCLDLGQQTGRVMVTGGDDKKVNMWTVGKPGCTQSLSGHIRPIGAVRLDVTEDMVAAGSTSGALKIWDLKAAKVVRTFLGHKGNIRTLDFHPYNEYVASGSKDTNMTLWDVKSKGCIFTYKGHTSAVNCVRFSPDGRWIASADDDGILKLWDLCAGKLWTDFKGHEGPISSIEFHPTEFLVASGSADRTVKYWDVERLQLVSSNEGDATGVRRILFHPEGHCLYSGSEDVLNVYGWEPEQCYDTLPMGWGKVMDLCLAQNQLIGATCTQRKVCTFVVDISRVEPVIHTDTLSSRRSFLSLYLPTQSTRQAPKEEKPEPFPAPPDEDVPSPVIVKPPTPMVEPVPAPPDEDMPSPVIVKPPTPMVEPVPAPPDEDMPSPVIVKAPTPMVEPFPAPPDEDMPSPVIVKAPIPMVEPVPAPPDDDMPSPVIVKAPIPMVEPFPAPPDEDMPSPVIVKAPTPMVEPVPAPPNDDMPSPVIVKQPSQPTISKLVQSSAKSSRSATTGKPSSAQSKTQRHLACHFQRPVLTPAPRKANPWPRNPRPSPRSKKEPTSPAKAKLAPENPSPRNWPPSPEAKKEPTAPAKAKFAPENPSPRNWPPSPEAKKEPTAPAKAKFAPENPSPRNWPPSPEAKKEPTSPVQSAAVQTEGINPEDFLPQNMPTSRDGGACAAINDTEALDSARTGHNSMRTVLTSRFKNLQVVWELWSGGDTKTALDSALGMNDQSLVLDLLNILITKPDLWNLDLCSTMAPHLCSLITTEYENYETTALTALRLILKNFASVIKSNRVAPPANAVDISREERYHKCKVLYEHLMEIRRNLKEQTHSPEQAPLVREIITLISQLD